MTVEELRVVISAEFSGLKNSINKSKKSLKSVEQAAKSVQGKLQNAFNINSSKMERSFNNIFNGADKLEGSFKDMQGTLAQTQNQLRELGSGFSISGLSLSMEGMKKQILTVDEALQELLPKWSQLENERLSGKITEKEYERSFDELKKKYSEIFSLIEALNKEKILKLSFQVDPSSEDNLITMKSDFDMQAAQDFIKNYSPEAGLRQAEQSLDYLKKQLEQQKSALKGATSDLKFYNSELQKTQKQIDKLTAKWYEMTANMREVGSQMGKVYSKSDLESAIPGLKEINNHLRALKTTYETMYPAQQEASQAQQKLTYSIASTKEQISDMKNRMKEAKKEIKKLGTQTKKTSKLLSSFLMTAKFMAFSKLITLVTKDLGECFNQLMKFDNAKNNIYGYNAAVSDLTSAFKRMSAEIAVTMANIVAAIGPALTWILNIISNLIEGINAFIAAVQGKDKYIGVNKDYWKNYADGIKDATNAQKKFLAGFDELTVLQDNTNKKEEKPEDLYVEKDVSDGLKNMAKELAAVLALVAGYELLKKRLGFLANLFGKKNNLLDTQTGLTQKETAAVGALNPAYALAAAGALGLATALEKLKMPQLEGVPSLVPALQPALELVPQLATALATGLAPAFELAGQKAGSMVPQLEGVRAGVLTLVPALATAAASVLAFSQMPSVKLSVGLDTAPLQLGLATATALYTGFFAGLVPALVPLMQPVLDLIGQTWESINLGFEQEGATILTNLGAFFPQLLPIFSGGFLGIQALIDVFSESSKSKVSLWGTAIAGIFGILSGYMGESIYSGLLSAGDIIVPWCQQTYQSFVVWGQGVVSLFANVGQSIVDTLISKLSSAWANIKSFASQAASVVGGAVSSIGDWVADHGTQITAGLVIGGALTIGAIALAPATGGASLGALPALAALADGGVLTTPTPALVGEYPGAKSNPEIVSPQNIMRETMEDANSEVVNAIYAIGNQLTKTIEEKDTDVYMDGDKVTRKITKKQKEQSKYSSPSLVMV